MVDSKAEEDDDEGFGDFTFASSDQINGRKPAISNDDDDWGDFVESPLRSAPPTGVFNAQSSKPSDPSGCFPDQSRSTTESALGRAESHWVKPRGALPLSLFGDAEQEEEESGAVGPPFKDSAVDIKYGTNIERVSDLCSQVEPVKAEKGFNLDSNRSDSNAIEKDPILNGTSALGMDSILNLFAGNNDIQSPQINTVSEVSQNMGSFSGSNNLQSPPISSVSGVSLDMDLFSVGNNLMSQQIKAVSGLSADSNGSDPNVIEKDSILKGASSLGMDSILDLFAGNNVIQSPQIDTASGVSQNMDLFSGSNNLQGEQIKAVNGLNAHSDFFGGQQIKVVSGFNSYSSGMNRNAELFFGSIGFDAISNGFSQDQLNNFETSNGLSSNLSASSPTTMGMDLYSDPLGGAEEFGGDYEGWEFKDAYSETKAGVWSDKVGRKDEGHFGVTGLSCEVGNGFQSDLFPSSNGFSVQPGEVDITFDFKRLTVAQNGFNSDSLFRSEQNGTPNGLNSDCGVGIVESDESFGDFEGAFAENGLNQEHFPNLKVRRKDEGNFGETGSSFEFGDGSNGSDLFSSSNGFSVQPREEVDVSFDFKQHTVAQNGFSSTSLFKSERNDTENGLNSDGVVGIVESDESFGDFEGAFTETGLNQERNETGSDNHRGALPLSIFGDEELETDDSPNIQDAFTFKPSYPRNGINSQGSNISINDLISNLYCQAEQIPPVDDAGKHTGNGLDSSNEVMDLTLVNSDDDFEDSSWDFKDASIQTSTIDQTSLWAQVDTCDNFTTNSHMINFRDFYCKLKDELSAVCRGHLNNLMRDKHAAGLSGEDAKVAAIDKEIKEACKELHEENIYSQECLEDELPRDVSLKEFIEVSKLKFQVLESEFGLSGRLHLAEQDLGSAVELMKHATSMLDVLTLGSMEDQGIYVYTWSKMISVCAQELKHGSWIWKQLVEKNIQSEILSEPRGKGFILTLGEIYRIVAVLGASTKLYKPWILSSSIDSTSIYALLEECYTLWSTSGIQEALEDISDPIDIEYHGTIKALRESIRFIHSHDELTLGNHILNQQASVCRLSLLTSKAVPEIKMVLWNGKCYFLPLANLWANLINCDPPELPYLDVGS
ncbi:hypothetical protein RHGRI_021281 [Rhododendron griersonianum]|uniref:Synergin gamma C-terminal domain-containing protein n=1 Tax=Rhododendron griersonianum TaxID=479676 RepID=A0AAV6JMX7_9ERIC|nr:hypothetical protein RHGRI_021281 [Rhododendron griersonianum]